MAKLSFKKFAEEVEKSVEEIFLSNIDLHKIEVPFGLAFRNEKEFHSDIYIYHSDEIKNEKKVIFNITASRKFAIIENFLIKYLDLLIPFNIHNAKINSKINYTVSLGDEFIRANITHLIAENYNFNILNEKVLKNIELARNELDALSDIRVLDILANEKLNDSAVHPRNIGSGIYYHKMIIAKLTGNKMYEEIYKYFNYILEEDIKKQTRYSEKNKVHLIIVKQLYEDLKSVKPLENPGLI